MGVRVAGAAVVATAVALSACSSSSSVTTTTLAPIATAVSTTSTTTSTTVPTTRPPVVTLPPDTTTSTTTTTTTSTTTTTTLVPPITTVPRTAALVLRDDGLGDARFGTDPEAVIAYVTALAGRPTADSGWADPLQFGVCPGSEVRVVTWGDLRLWFSDESVVMDGRRHFFTWSYGPAFGSSVQPPAMATDAGVGIGATVAQLRAAYPDAAISDDDVLGPVFVVSDELSGTLTGLADTDVVRSFDGGIPCGE